MAPGLFNLQNHHNAYSIVAACTCGSKIESHTRHVLPSLWTSFNVILLFQVNFISGLKVKKWKKRQQVVTLNTLPGCTSTSNNSEQVKFCQSLIYYNTSIQGYKKQQAVSNGAEERGPNLKQTGWAWLHDWVTTPWPLQENVGWDKRKIMESMGGKRKSWKKNEKKMHVRHIAVETVEYGNIIQ